MKTILFDLDGTLIKSTEIILEAFKITFKNFLPTKKLKKEEFTNMLGLTLIKTFTKYEEDLKKVDEMISFYREVSNKMIEKGLKAYPGAIELMSYLKEKGCKIGVVTSKMRQMAQYNLELTGLNEYVDGLIGYEDTINHKPSPDPIIKALKMFDADKETTVYIGDHENDIMAARQAGIIACAVTYSHRIKEMLAENPDYVIDELSNIKYLIQGE